MISPAVSQETVGFCFRFAYLVRNSSFALWLTSAIEIYSWMNCSLTDIPRFGRLFRSSLRSFQRDSSSIV